MSLYEMRNTVAGRVAGTLAAFALVVSLSFGGAFNAQAQSNDLEAEIARLMALIEQLQSQIGGSTAPAGDFNYDFNRNMTIGATGVDVTKLQQYLNLNPATQVAAVGVAGGPGSETAYYGPATGAAVKKYQELHRADILTPLGLTVGTVNFGISTRTFMNAQIASTPTTPTDPTDPTTPGTGGDLEGGEGLIELYDLSSATLELDTGETDVIYEFEVEAYDSDVEINRVDFIFEDRPWLALDEVVLLADGREVGSVSRERDYTRTGTDYRARFSGLDVVVREGDAVEFTLEATALSAIRGGGTVTTTVYLPDNGIRGVDGAGLVVYSDLALGDTDVTVEESFGDGTFRVRRATDSPRASTFGTDETVEVASFDVEARNGDMTLYTVEVTPTGSADLRSLRLVDGRDSYTGRLDSGTYTFEVGRRDGLSIREGRSVSFDLEAVFDGAGTFTAGEVEVFGENSDYQPEDAQITFSEAHTVGGVVSFVRGHYLAPVVDGGSTTANGYIGITFEIGEDLDGGTLSTLGDVVFDERGVDQDGTAVLYQGDRINSSYVVSFPETLYEGDLYTLVIDIDSVTGGQTLPELEIDSVAGETVTGVVYTHDN